MGGDLDSYIEINTAIDDFNFITPQGYMCTLLNVHGKLQENDLYGSYRRESDVLCDSIGSYFNSENHLMQVVFRRLDHGRKEIVENSMSSARDRSKKIGFDAEDLFESQVNTFANKVNNESVVIALWTKTNDMTSKDFEKEQAEIDNELEEIQGKDSAQNLVGGYTKVLTTHNEFVKDVIMGLGQLQVHSTKLTRSDAINTLVKSVSPEVTADVDIIFPDSDYYARGKETILKSEHKLKNALWPSISQQIIPEDEVEADIKAKVCQVGTTLFSTFEVSSPPRNLVLFNHLTDYINMDTPCQISFFIDSNVSFGFFWKSALSRFPIPASNKRLSKAIAATNKLKIIKQPNVEYKITVTTWANDYEKLSDNREHLKAAISKWGGAQAREYKGNPIKALLSSIAGLNTKTFGGTVFAPLKGVMPQLPLSRRISIWNKSFLSFMADGGKLFPYAPTSSSLQAYWNIGVLAGMGSGKSVLLQCISLAHMLSSTEKGRLPMIGYLDIGFSGKGVIDALRSLSESKYKEKYLHLTLENSENHAYNVLDTQLGCREPDADQSKSVLNFFLSVVTPTGEQKPHPDMEALLQQAIADAYTYVNDDNKPKEYKRGLLPKVDEALDKHSVETDNLSWWEVVDFMFDKGEATLAARAQRYAVPTLQDVITQFNVSNSIKNSFTKVMVSRSESIIEYAQRLLTQAIDAYPLIAKPTRINVEGAHFIILDLNNVAKGTGESGKKQAAVFYNLGRFIVSRNFFVTQEILNHAPKRYKEYHAKRAEYIRGIPKLLVYDEFHRVGWLDAIVNQVLTEMREGRKWNLSILMASQLLKDFSPDMRALMSSIFLLSNSVDTPENVQKTMGLNSYLMHFFNTYCNGPDGSNGTPMVAKIKLKKKEITQSFRFVISPYLYWITTSDAADSGFKKYVVERLGGSQGLAKLSKMYPYGVRKVLEELTDNHPEQSVRENPKEFLFKTML